MDPMDHRSESSSHPCAKSTSGPRYCLVFMMEAWCSSSYVELPKAMSLSLLLTGRRYSPGALLDDEVLLLLSHSSSRGKCVTRGGSVLCKRMFSGFRSVCVMRRFP